MGKHKRDKLLVWTPIIVTLCFVLFSGWFCAHVIPNSDLFDGWDKDPWFKQKTFVASLAFISNVLIIIGTGQFMRETFFGTAALRSKSAAEASKQANSLFFTILMNFSTIALSVSVIWMYVAVYIDGYGTSCDTRKMQSIFHWNEVASILMFLLFCWADWRLIAHLRQVVHSRENDKGDSSEEAKEVIDKAKSIIAYLEQVLPLTDIVGLIGIIVIFCLTLFFQTPFGSFFTEGFASGALAFHIIFTQFNAAYIRFKQLSM